MPSPSTISPGPDQAVEPSGPGNPIKRDITCPHCWSRVLTGDIRWVARHDDLRGDAMLGPDAMRRFLPTRFDVDGNALDARGSVCRDLACPSCHLPISRGLLEANQLYFSLIGVPGSGKSYFTAAMTWRLRTLMPEAFGLTFTDLDVAANQALLDNEQTLFLEQGESERLVSIEKTQMQGANYDPVHRGGQTVQLPRPFQFFLAANTKPADGETALPPRVLNLYDNAGEHFLPGADNTLNPGTQHLARANALMFLFDPLQDARFRAVIASQSDDPQIDQPSGAIRQDTILNEACARLRRYADLSPSAKFDQPLLILLAKSDAWIDLIEDLDLPNEPVKDSSTEQLSGVQVDTELVDETSRRLRDWLQNIAPEFVALAEGLHKHVAYLPVSALGGAPVRDASGLLMVRSGTLSPRWVAAPVLYALAKWSRNGLHGNGPGTV